MALSVDKKRCPQNHACPLVKICPLGAISQNGFGLPVIDPKTCIECGRCARKCGKHAICKAI